MKYIIFLLAFLFYSPSYSQDWRYDEFIPKYKEEILNSSNLKKSRKTRILRDLSFIGAYQELYAMDSKTDSLIGVKISNVLKTHEIQNAKKYILSQSEKDRIVIINESHHRPEHRNFTKNLLEGLYGQGYRYLALEAILSNQHYDLTGYPINKYNLGDTTLLTRGYPLMKACSGTYVKEPEFGNLIRKALKIGFTIIGYEYNRKNRELEQAKNIAKIFDIDSSAKVLILCGYSHVIECPIAKSDGENDTRMAGHLKEITGINPFTIDQTSYFNLSNVNIAIYQNTEDREPQSLIKDNEPFKSHKEDSQLNWDLTIFHRPIDYIHGRPEWKVRDQMNNKFEIESSLIFIDYPLRIKLLDKGDSLDAVPIDILESQINQEIYRLYGDIEEGKIVVENPNGDRQIFNQIGKSF